MATVKTIKPAGAGDYTTLALWEDAVDGESSAAQWAECYSGGNLGPVTFSGWSATPTSDNYPKIYAAAGHHHSADIAAGAYISAASPIAISVSYTRIDGIRINGTNNSNKVIDFLGSGTSQDSRVDNCFVHGTFQYGVFMGQSTTGVTSSNYITNNIIVVDGTAATTPTGIYAYGTDGSSGTTNMYIYNNSIYVDNATTLTNYGIRFANVASCTLNITVENNISIGSVTSAGVSITYAYNQVAFDTGTKTFNNNIGSDNTADDFGGSRNQLNETAAKIWTDAPNDNFRLKSNSVALDFGKTISAVTTDMVGIARPQPDGGSYDMGALERAVTVEIVYGTIPSFESSGALNILDQGQSLRAMVSTHEYLADALIDGPTGHVCQLIYPVTKNSVCPNCIYSPRQKRSSNIYKSGGPVPFENHTTCPWCGGEGRSSREMKEDIRLRVYWSQKDWSISSPVENPDSSVMVVGYIYNLPKLEKADRILVNKNTSAYKKWIFERAGEAIPWGMAQDRYFAQMLRRVGGG